MCILAITMTVQTGATQHGSVQTELLKNIQALWKAWQDQNPEPFKQWLDADSYSVNSLGRVKFAEFIEMVAGKQCEVKSYSIDEKGAHVSQLDTNTYLIIYSAEQDATCAGVKAPSPVTVSEIWSNKDGKWKGVFYQETQVTK